MPSNHGGFLIRFDEDQRATFLREVRNLENGFSDALSREDWAVRQWEVCGLLFEPQVVTHWALARKGKGVATGKVRVEFTEVTSTLIPLAEVERRVGPRILQNVVRARAGVGGKVPPATWEGMKIAVGAIDAASLATLERLERLRDQSRKFINRPGTEVVAQQRDAVGLALDAFDETGQLRKRTLTAWAAPTGNHLTSFLEGLEGVRTIEDQLIARDAAVFPGAGQVRHTVLGAVFGVGDRKLEVFNVNRSAIERSLGVDLLYFNEAFDAWTLIQYKSMERPTGAAERLPFYRPDESFNNELARMKAFRDATPDAWTMSDGLSSYRLCGDGFYFKLCSRVQLEVLSDTLLPGMYLSRQVVEAALIDPATVGERGGRIITFENTKRHISNTLFADLLRDGWIGTRGVSSARIGQIVRDGLVAGRAIVLARSRPSLATANPTETLMVLGL